VAPIDDIRSLADKHSNASREALTRGRQHGYDATAEAAEQGDIALVLRAAAAEMATMDPAEQQDYAHRLKFALWARLDDAPRGFDDSEAHE
jgi:hypothetical protein